MCERASGSGKAVRVRNGTKKMGTNPGQYDVLGSWQRLRASHAQQWWDFVQFHQNQYLTFLKEACSWASEEQQLGGCHLSRALLRQNLVAKAEQLKVKRDKEVQRQKEVDSAQAKYDAMGTSSFVVALHLEAARLRCRTAEEQKSGTVVQTVAGSLLFLNERIRSELTVSE